MPLAPSLTGATLASLFIGVFLCSGSANTFNQVLEVTRDAKMVRTMKRPLPSKALSRVSAIGFGTLGHFAGSALLWYAVNPTTALLAGCTTALYLAAYTPLKGTDKPRVVTRGCLEQCHSKRFDGSGRVLSCTLNAGYMETRWYFNH